MACNNNSSPDRGMYNKAIAISQKLDSNALQPFKDWNITRQEQTTILHRNKADDSTGYTIMYEKVKDTCFVTLLGITNLRHDFHSTYLFDTTRFWSFSFAEVKQNIVRITVGDNNGQDHTTDTSAATSQVFPGISPFNIADSLTRLMNNLQIVATSYKPANGNGMVFWLSWNRLLVFLPGDGNATLAHKDSSFWKKILPTGRRISKNWLLCDYERHP
ncbi:hypothetical protein F5148DRAFT_1291718 [Russula earlei]|uniref:Uncharacterized protein n=1 Tax=Russula earlei TaxID=71964 RepID=A0ACC0TVZ0_9AGAM|nr:hypothetical protein F5148DRAFT_1291718 [Russula earlei]